VPLVLLLGRVGSVAQLNGARLFSKDSHALPLPVNVDGNKGNDDGETVVGNFVPQSVPTETCQTQSLDTSPEFPLTKHASGCPYSQCELLARRPSMSMQLKEVDQVLEQMFGFPSVQLLGMTCKNQ
jgi:hypothetical protein